MQRDAEALAQQAVAQGFGAVVADVRVLLDVAAIVSSTAREVERRATAA